MHNTLIICLLLCSFNALARSPVWKIEAHGNTLFLAGTIHLLRASDYPLPIAFNNAYQQSQALVFETDLDALESPEFSQKLLSAIQLKKGQHLLQFLTPTTQQALLQYAENNNIDIEQLANYKPSFVAITLALIELHKLKVNQIGVDAYFNQKAKKDGKVTEGLETPEQQIQFLSQLAKGYENEFIMQTLTDIKDINQQFDTMVASWRQGNLKRLEDFFIEPTKKQFPEMHQQILINRNQAWLPLIKQHLRTDETEMVLVGSAHLAGQDGLIESLIQAGYKITQLD